MSIIINSVSNAMAKSDSKPVWRGRLSGGLVLSMSLLRAYRPPQDIYVRCCWLIGQRGSYKIQDM